MATDAQQGVDTAWLLLHRSAVPEQWRARAVPAALIALRPAEVTAMLVGRPELDGSAVTSSVDEQLSQLVAQGVPKTRMAARLGISPRTLDRRLRTLRDRHGARTLPELTAVLVRYGYGDPNS